MQVRFLVQAALELSQHAAGSYTFEKNKLQDLTFTKGAYDIHAYNITNNQKQRNAIYAVLIKNYLNREVHLEEFVYGFLWLAKECLASMRHERSTACLEVQESGNRICSQLNPTNI